MFLIFQRMAHILALRANSKEKAMNEDQAKVLHRFVNTTEERIASFAKTLLSNENFVNALTNLIARTLDIKSSWDNNLKVALSSMNIPSTQDIKRLREKIADLDDLIEDLHDKISELEDKIGMLLDEKPTLLKSQAARIVAVKEKTAQQKEARAAKPKKPAVLKSEEKTPEKAPKKEKKAHKKTKNRRQKKRAKKSEIAPKKNKQSTSMPTDSFTL
jgi:chromosome segregation ATPase